MSSHKQAKYTIIIQIYLQSILKSLGNAPKMTIYILRRSYMRRSYIRLLRAVSTPCAILT